MRISLPTLLLAVGCATTAPERPASGSALDAERFAAGYPAVMQKLEQGSTAEQVEALRTIAHSGEVDAIPLLLPLVFGPEGEVGPEIRSWAAAALRDLVAHNELRRRDPEQPNGVHLLATGPGHRDLSELVPIVDKMLAPEQEDPAVLGAGATMAGYLQLEQLRGRLVALSECPHPAVRTSAFNALMLIGGVEPVRAGLPGSIVVDLVPPELHRFE